MRLEISNEITIQNRRAKYEGRIINGDEIVEFDGSVPLQPTQQLTVRKILTAGRARLRAYKRTVSGRNVWILPTNNIFKRIEE